MNKASENLHDILSTYPDLKGEEYSVWSDCLKKYLVPSVGLSAC